MLKFNLKKQIKTGEEFFKKDVIDNETSPVFKNNDIISVNGRFYEYSEKEKGFYITDNIYIKDVPKNNSFFYFKVAVIVMSDSCAAGESLDKSGLFISELVKENKFIVSVYKIVPDNKSEIENIYNKCLSQNISLVLTTGGTGLSPSDITPEITKKIAPREVPGISQGIIQYSLNKTPHAMFGRIYAGCCGRTLFVNLPGSLKAVKECCEVLFPTEKNIMYHALEKLSGVIKKCG
ncbi:MAG: MogA/MoaB family molybdenum cofactor biosynthesis protein [Candidatus Muiribacteriota bacterium]